MTQPVYSFDQQHSIEERKAQSAELPENQPNPIRAIFQKVPWEIIGESKKHKFLLDRSMNAYQVTHLVQDRILGEIPVECIRGDGSVLRLFLTNHVTLFVGKYNMIPEGKEVIGDLYEQFKGDDGVLSVYYSKDVPEENNIFK
ncbi:MAG: hypothetical protein JSS09_01100 [Verrucomicrobia bacterium]|nr:hypothetical protein [Verrucomicrobiota bacterium]